MHTVTARLDDELVAELDAECDERRFRSRTDYIEYILENRAAVFADQPAERGVSGELAEHEERLEDAESRLDDLEASAHTHTWAEDEQGN